eukprot:TRINITY_DN1052_c0_g1_i1.p1 TRINITY_DN1052_c0_g1~~TRINITY_DN1052_c0_g1_i1.p1  ORF type:complete len:535 (+),score=160.66 TRINITY_DN1052_c0_g1_i1:82-1686(+)
MAKLLNILFALCILVLGVSAHRRNVDNFVGRSGQMIVELPEEDVHDDSALLFKGRYFDTMDMESIKDTQFMDLYAHVAGIPSANVAGSHTGFPTSSVFSKPKASLIVSIAGAGSDALTENADLQTIMQGAKQVKLTSTSYPLNKHVMLNNMATGTPASVHGIVGRTWTSPSGKKVVAHEKGAHSVASNIADILLQQYHGRSLVVSASASHSYASVFAAHPSVAAHGWNAHAYSLSDRFHFTSIYSAPHPVHQSLTLPHAGLQSVLAGAGFNSVFSTSYSSYIISFNGVSFNLRTKADSKLFAELAFVYNLIEQLNEGEISSLVRDDIPDLFAITFSGLKAIGHKYGRQSEEYTAALHLVSQAAKSLSDAIDAAYDFDTITVVAFVNPHHTIPSDTKTGAYKSARADMSMQDFEKNFPAIYSSSFSSSKHQREQQCVSLQRDLGLQVHCFSAASPSFFYSAVMDSNNTNNHSNSSVWNQQYRESKYVISFWILFFITIILVSFVGWGVYNLTFVGGDASRDSLLYRVSSRHHHQL